MEKKRNSSATEPKPKRVPGPDPENCAWDALEMLSYIGTEYAYQEDIDKHSWSWTTLIKDLMPNGSLFEAATPSKGEHKYVYLFATSEVQQVTTEAHKKGVNVPIPVITALISSVDLGPCRVVVKGVQMEKADILDGAKLRLEYARMPLLVHRRRAPKVPIPYVNVLHCSGRVSAGMHKAIELQKQYEFANPYFFIPKFIELDLKQEPPVTCAFSVKLPRSSEYYMGTYSNQDTFPDFSHEIADEELKLTVKTDKEIKEITAQVAEQGNKKGKTDSKLEFTEKDLPRLITQEKYDEFLKSIETAAKGAYEKCLQEFKENKDALEAELKKLTPEQVEGLNSISVVKYYPSHPNFDVSKFTSAMAGRYVGEAQKVVVCEKDEDEEKSDL